VHKDGNYTRNRRTVKPSFSVEYTGYGILYKKCRYIWCLFLVANLRGLRYNNKAHFFGGPPPDSTYTHTEKEKRRSPA
jgi:hypothetical protein